MKKNEWLDGVPGNFVLERYELAAGKEVSSGKFWSERSSSNLVANAFGWFMAPGRKLPALPKCEAFGEPDSVTVEECLRFPWARGRHPWLDVVIETPKALIGVESKRYEPFASKTPKAWRKTYFGDGWGDKMAGYQALRDGLSGGTQAFTYLDAPQLVKHALGLRTQAAKKGKSAVLVYLYAEPKQWAGLKRPAIEAAVHAAHSAEAKSFGELVKGDEVGFVPVSWSELLFSWQRGTDKRIAKHAKAVATAYDIGH